LTILLLVLTLHAVGAVGLGKKLLGLNAGYLMTAIAVQLASTAAAAFRYHLIMGALDFREDMGFYFRSYFKGAFLNQVLPGSIGGDAARVLELGRLGYRKRDAFYGVFVDRIVGLAGLLLLNLLANNLVPELLPGWLYSLINVISIAGIAGMIALARVRKLFWLERFSVLHPLLALSAQFRRVYHSSSAIFSQVGLSVLIHILSIFALYALAHAIGLDMPLGVLLVVVPPVFLLTLLPISLAGWGVRESAMVGIFMLLGVSNVSVLSLSVLYGLTLILASLPGLYFLLFQPETRR
jgi:hypothetical protein